MAKKKLLPLIAFVILLFFPNYVCSSLTSFALKSLFKIGTRIIKRAAKKAAKEYLIDKFSSTTQGVVQYSNVTFSNDSWLFNMELHMGTQYNSLNVSIDTGSELLWVQCKLYSSTTYEGGGILYNDYYNSSSMLTMGNSSQDVVSFDGFNVGSRKIVQYYNSKTLSFGCETQGILTNYQIPGLAGLNRGKGSLAYKYGNKFSYCLPTLDSTGFISFLYDTSTAPFNYTPMLDDYDLYGDFYILNLTSITVDIGLQLQHISQITAIFTTSFFSYFDSETYRELGDTLASHMTSLQNAGRVNISESIHLDYCYSFSGEELPNTPNVSFIFEGQQAVLELDNVNLLYPVNESVVCFAFLDLGSDGYSGFNIIGSYQLTNHLVEHDNVNKRVGFAKYDDCSLFNQQSAALGNSAALLHLLPFEAGVF